MQFLKPPRLAEGDTFGIIAPSFPLLPAWRAAYEQGKAMLGTLGFTIKEGRTIGLCRYWAAGTPQDQADDINAMFVDPEVKAIIALTGGFPGMSVLDRIDYELVRSCPKPFLGFSDITLYHLAFFAHCGLVGFHRAVSMDGRECMGDLSRSNGQASSVVVPISYSTGTAPPIESAVCCSIEYVGMQEQWIPPDGRNMQIRGRAGG